jgi:hypothetical protein
MPVRSQMAGTWPKTISPAVVAVAGSFNPACRWAEAPILTLAADQRAPKSSGSARDDDAQHPEPGMVAEAEREIMNRHAAHWRPYLERGDMMVFGRSSPTTARTASRLSRPMTSRPCMSSPRRTRS